MPTLRKPASVPERGETTVLETALLASNSSRRAVKRSRNFLLVCPSLLYQADHGVCFGHVVAHRILGMNNACDHDYSVPILGANKATIIDDQRLPGEWHPGEKIFLLVARRHSGDYTVCSKKRTCMGPHPVRA